MTKPEAIQPLAALEAELATLEALPMSQRTPEALDRAFALDKAIRARKRARGPQGSTRPHGLQGSAPVAVLVHLPKELHAALKKSCRAKGETMASTLRGLVRAHLGQ